MSLCSGVCISWLCTCVYIPMHGGSRKSKVGCSPPFETRSLYVTLADLKLCIDLAVLELTEIPLPLSLSIGNRSVHHHAQSCPFWFLRQGPLLESRTWCLGRQAGQQDQEIQRGFSVCTTMPSFLHRFGECTCFLMLAEQALHWLSHRLSLITLFFK